MNKNNSQVNFIVALVRSLDSTFLSSLLAICWRIQASIRGFSSRELNPQSFQLLELRLERLARELARVLLQYALNDVGATSKPCPIHWDRRTYLPVTRQARTIETRFGTVSYCRWIYQNEWFFVRDVAAMDLRLGLVGDRVSPALAHKLGRLAADLPQQPAIQQLAEQFNVCFSVDTYRSVVESLSYEVRYLHDNVAIDMLARWIEDARKSEGKHEVLLLVGRDGVHVPMRGCWKEAGCATLAVYDRKRKRLGTIYLGEMPQSKQTELTKRLTKVISGTLHASGTLPLKLRYVTDAGSLPRGYFRKVLAKMKHPVTGKALEWSWGLDFFHACEYVSKLADSLFGIGTMESQDWFKENRHTLRHVKNGVRKVMAHAAQHMRRHGLKGSMKDYNEAKSYLSRYGANMDYAQRSTVGDPIGSGVTEAGCKVIFNQRIKQSGMRWSKRGGQWIVDLRTACRSGMWDQIWNRYLSTIDQPTEISQPKNQNEPAAA